MAGYGQVAFGAQPYGLELSDIELSGDEYTPIEMPAVSGRWLTSGYGIGPFGAFPYGSGGGETSVSNFQPGADTPVRRLDAIEFDITNPAWELSDIQVRLVFPSGLTESIWDPPAGFANAYKRGSSRSPIAYGYHYVLRRTGGWPTPSFQILVRAMDVAVETVTGQSS